MGYTDLGSGQGRLYAVTGGNIHLTKWNSKEGLRLMKELALKSRALGLGQRGRFTIEIGEITDAGNVTAVPVNAVDQINGSIAYDVGDEIALATAIAAAINSTTPATGQNYSAVSVGNLVVGYAQVGAPTSINGHTVAASNTGDITITTTDVEGVSDQTEIYSTTHGYQFYVDSGVNAPLNSYAGAEDVTKFIVPQTLDGKMPEATATLADGIATVPRVALLSSIALEAQTGNSDDCIGIEPQGYAEGDLVLVSGLDEDNAITFVQSENGNLVLKDEESYLSTGVGRWMLLKHNGGTFTELIRASSAQGLIPITYGQGQAAITAGTLVPGAQYLITDRGHRGLILTGVTTNRFSLEGQFIAAVPDYSNSTGNFIGDWYDGLTPSVNDICAYGAGLQYVNTTGTNTSTNPASDTTNWTLLPRATSTDYVVEVHDVEYNYNGDQITKRSDARGNTVYQGYIYGGMPEGFSTLDYFWWGAPNVVNNRVRALIYREKIRLTSGGAFIIDNIFEETQITTNNTITNIQNIAHCRLEGLFLLNLDSVGAGTVYLIDTTLTLNTGTSSIIFQGGSLTGCIFRGGAYTMTVKDVIQGAWCDFKKENQSAVALEVFDADNFTRKSISAGKSTVPRSTGIDGDNDIDINNVPAGIINVTSGSATETLTGYKSRSEFVDYYRIVPAAGLVLTVEGSDPATPANGEIMIPPALWDDISPGTYGTVTLDGDNGDYLEMRIVWVSTSVTYAIVEKVIQF